MHVLQPKHSLMKPQEVEELLTKLNVSSAQLPKIKFDDPALPEGCDRGDVIKIERKNDEGVSTVYYRLVV
ncbi:DNA-directed RNA polymerase subunit H [Candidatus Pacearchaeota archaeon CG10_big_fil_rev_8_21_14_0_10_35_13]|nr:MAG: DNA-directed RNA polymerase subunit H [Candidatus Pacearchaeota archaeon CG10_big_fil_rev_8_21_14_0_10_35_13]